MNMDINGLTYHVWRQGNGTPLLLLHGFTGEGDTWRDVSDLLGSEYDIIAPDLIGHGRTAAPDDPIRYDMQHATADLVALLDDLQIDRVHLVGYSMGGRLALYTAVHHTDRVRTLTLESASPGLSIRAERDERRQRDNALADRIERDGIVAFVDFWQSLPLWDSQKTTLTTGQLADLRQQRLSQRPHGLANSLRGMGTGVQPSLWDDLSRLTIPVQLIVGEYDTKFIAINQQMNTHIPASRLSIMSNAGHTTHLENPAAFSDVLQQFLSTNSA